MRKILFTKKGLDEKLIAKELGGKLMIDFVEVLTIENIEVPAFDLKNFKRAPKESFMKPNPSIDKHQNLS